MTATGIAFAHLKHRAALTLLTLVTLSLALAAIIVLLLYAQQYEARLNKDVKGIHLVVGKAANAMQLTRQSVLHIDPPTGFIPPELAEKIRKHALVSWSAPIYVGDSFRGYRIVGTEQKFSFLYKAILEPGGIFWGTPYDAVIGSGVAKRTGLDVGHSFKAAHGLVRGGPLHSIDHAYVVTGILQPTGGVIDHLILTSMQSQWDTYSDTHSTALILRSKNPQALAAMLQQQPSLQTAVPAIEATTILDNMQRLFKPLYAIGIITILATIFSIFFTLSRSLAARRADMAMLRVMGAKPKKLFQIVFMEAVLLAVVGTVTGFLLGHLTLQALAWWLPPARSIGLTGLDFNLPEILLLVSTLLFGILAGLYPAIQTARTPVVETLARCASDVL
jgi:putative ABC transport system permease protein